MTNVLIKVKGRMGKMSTKFKHTNPAHNVNILLEWNTSSPNIDHRAHIKYYISNLIILRSTYREGRSERAREIEQKQ